MVESKPLRADAQRNRDAIIAAARSVFAQDEHLRFDDFAARAGVGVGTLYRHFPTRASLAAAVYRVEVASLCERAGNSPEPPGQQLEAFLRRFVNWVLEHPALARSLAATVDPEIQAEGGALVERTLTELLTRAAADGAIRADVLPGAVLVALHGIGSASDRADWMRESRALAEMVIRGLRCE